MIFHFGDFELDTVTGQLQGPGGTVTLRRQTSRLLEVLLRHAPELVGRDTLLDEAWGRTALSPNVLPQAISELRQALNDSARSPRYIETLHRRGYRIIAPVQRLEMPPPSKASPGPEAASETAGRSRLAVAGSWAALAGLAVVLCAWWFQHSERQWLDRKVLPEVESLIETNVTAAWRVARAARQRAGDDPRLEQLWLNLTLPVDLASEPLGAEVAVADYAGGPNEWIVLGRTPLAAERLPLGMMRFRVTLNGHTPIEAAPNILPRAEIFQLHRLAETPRDMVYVPAGPVTYLFEQRRLPGFWIDRHEVTNRQFRAFVADGGYRNPAYWPEEIPAEGTTLTRSEILERLVDRTGMPGPATWALGTYPEGRDEHPVEGISWYEARAYAQWSGKRLPSVFHWYRAAGLGTRQAANFSNIIAASNFSGRDAVPVGSLGGLGPYGTYDMAGNVAEWCVNSAGDLRHALGASWQDNSYQFSDANAFDPMTRRSGMGLRLVLPTGPVDADLDPDLQLPEPVVSEPVDEATFAVYRRMYDYDPAPLEASIDEIDDSHQDWRRERVSFAAAYPNDRVTVQIFLPHAAEPPYQTVIHFPGGDAMLLGDSRDAGLLQVEPFLRTGRAVVYPVYQGTFERRPSLAPGPLGLRNLIIQQVKDVRRTLDYLETRPDIDSERFAFHGVSYGAARSPFVLATEDRFRTAMLVSVGLSPTRNLPPEIHQFNYLPRIRMPVLMISGREDFSFPYKSSQLPFFELIGTPGAHKRHVALQTGHLPPGYTDVVHHLLEWSDRWLGPLEAPISAVHVASEGGDTDDLIKIE
ncbi:MAG: SUMF1/EgtB/PvdO family nonheme iron enzyme [Wenzhouxiangellaceae bacterium]